MLNMTLEGVLPVALANGKKAVQMRQLTVLESLQVHGSLKPDQFVVLGELANMTSLVVDGELLPLSVEVLAASSRQNLDYLLDLRQQLDAKERADSVV